MVGGEAVPGDGNTTGAGSHDSGYGYDAFISYDHADVDWVRVLAGNLRNAGLRVFFECATGRCLSGWGRDTAHCPAIVAAGQSWRKPDPGVAGKGGSSLDKVPLGRPPRDAGC
jgi:hypothetical protein